MLAYEIYSFDKMNGYELIGVLPERRKVPTRMTRDSVLNWGKMLLGGNGNNKSIIFKQVTIDSHTGRIVWVNMALHKHQEIAEHSVA
jgi:hypothetical protein